MDKTSPWTWVGGWSAVVGGLCWAVKALGLMAAGSQPPVVYEVAPLFFPAAVVGLYALRASRPSRAARAGVAFAGVAQVCALASVVGLFLGPPAWTPAGDTVTVLTPFITAAALGWIVGMLLVGLEVRRQALLPGWWANAPVVLALSVVPLIALSPALHAVNGRLFELPTLLAGLEWVALGSVMVSVAARAAGRRPVGRSAERCTDGHGSSAGEEVGG